MADVLIAFAPVFKEYMHSESKLICSGIIAHRLDDVKNTLIENGYKVTSQKEQSEWFAIEACL